MRVFRDLEIVEQLGSGIPRILTAYGRDAFVLRKSFVRVTMLYAEPISAEAGAQSGARSGAQSRAQLTAILVALQENTLSAAELAEALNLESKTGAFKRTIKELLDRQLIAYTLPDKPNSRLQQYRLTEKGKMLLQGQGGKTND
jgi:predicted HTH transcriptional regulator